MVNGEKLIVIYRICKLCSLFFKLGATKDIGSALTRLCLRHRSVEAKLKTFCRYDLLCIYFIFIPIIKLVTNYNMFNELL